MRYHDMSTTAGGRVTRFLAVIIGCLTLTGCDMGVLSRYQNRSVSSVAGHYALSTRLTNENGGLDIPLETLGVPQMDLELAEDGNGILVIHDDPAEQRSLAWELTKESRMSVIYLHLREPVSMADDWATFLVSLEDNPTATEIQGIVSGDTILVKQKGVRDPSSLDLMFERQDA